MTLAPDPQISRADMLEAERAHLQSAGAQAAAGYSALCLSGGGIRSARILIWFTGNDAGRNPRRRRSFLLTQRWRVEQNVSRSCSKGI